jgi:uncharacterized protein (DUF1684 family)
MRHHRAGIAACLLLSLAAATLAADATYREEIAKWRQDFDTDVRKGGWLTLVNRVQLTEGPATVGSDSGSTVLLPARAPEHLGTISRTQATFQFEPARGVRYVLDGKSVAGRAELSTKSGTGRVQVGAIRLSVRGVGNDFYAMVTDDENPAIAKFQGISWFPIDPSWRIPARFVPYRQSESVGVPMTHVSSKTTMTSTGDVAFELEGHSVRLKTFLDENHLFVMFLDATNGRESYGGGRFLDAPLPKDGVTTLDFNKAYNPYCSVNDNVMCPVIPATSRLEVRVVAGEKYVRSD